MLIGIKAGVIMNGSKTTPDEQALTANLRAYLAQVLKTESGVVEIDGKDLKESRPDEDIFRFDGALATTAHVMNHFLRRFYKSSSPVSQTLFGAL